AWTLASSVTSVRTNLALAPIRAASCSPAATFTSARTTCAPAAAKRWAQAAPRPEAPPVMKNVWSPSCMPGSLRHQAQRLVRSRAEVIGQAEETPHPASKTGDQAGVPEPGKVMADGRLTEIESSGEVAHTSRLIGGFEHV